ncbi:MAG: hypothetical protein HYV95_13505 [Opitutae bacterium]|nr:hypothetical protein [Opitutae bacterium]
MNARRWLAGLFLLVAAPAGYMAWLTWRAGDSGKWLFGVFTLFFLLLAVTALLPEIRTKEKPETVTSTRFVPHWFMLLAIVALLLAVLLGIVNAVLRFLR